MKSKIRREGMLLLMAFNYEKNFEIVDSFEPVKLMRLNLVNFVKNISFDECFMNAVLKFIDNQKQYILFNQLKEIRNGKNVRK